MQLVVCEKPSVGAALAKALGAADHKNGYIEGDNIIVSWCIGHLVELASADVYDERYKKWSIEDLPIIPQKWQYIEKIFFKLHGELMPNELFNEVFDLIYAA